MTMIATRNHSFVDDAGKPDTIRAGRDRVTDDHPLVTAFPGSWRPFVLADELAVRSERVADLKAQAARARPSTSEPLSRTGREEAREADFWRSVEKDLHRDDRSAAERAEERFFDDALAGIERADAARLSEQTNDFREAWQGRLPAER